MGGQDYLCIELGVKRVHVQKIMRAIIELRDKIRTEWDESECFDVIPHILLNDERAMDKIVMLESTLNERDEEIVALRQEYESRIQTLLSEISEKETIIKQAEDDGFIFDDDGKNDNDSAYNSDSADVSSATDEDMPPLIDAQQTIAYFGDDNQQENEQQDVDEENEDNKNEEEQFEIVDVVHPNDASMEENKSEEKNLGQMDESTLAPSVDVIDKVLSVPNSPNLTPSASQQRLDKMNAGKKRKHHRKNSTKTGFWAQAKGGKRPPNGTKAYWLYLDSKHEKCQFCESKTCFIMATS